jgi:spermidine/putrescine transport system ATP-binding protein
LIVISPTTLVTDLDLVGRSAYARGRAVPDPKGHLELSHVTKRFGDAVAVNDVSFAIPRGAFATLLGPSGCGKTTTLRMIAGFYDPDAGEIILGGKRINDLPAHRRGTAMVFQDYALFPHMTVRDNVAYGLRLARRSRVEIERKVSDTLAFVGLRGLEQRWPGQLSGGQQQRVAVARALVVEPEVLLLDEPLSNLDAKLREQLRVELRTLQQRLRMTFVYVTHDQAEALSLSDWIAVMNEGRVEQSGSPWEIYYHPRTAFLADFVGAVNLVPGVVRSTEGARARVMVGSRELTIPVPAGMALSAGQEVRLCIRPETIEFARDGSAAGLVQGTVARRSFLGDRMRYWVTIDGRDWIVDQADPGAGGNLEGGVALALRPDRVHLIA